MDYREEFLQIWHQYVSRPGSEKLQVGNVELDGKRIFVVGLRVTAGCACTA